MRQLLQPGEAPLETVRNITLNGDVEVGLKFETFVAFYCVGCIVFGDDVFIGRDGTRWYASQR